MRAHTITATPMVNGRGGLQYHCTTCGTLTYFQPPTLPCLGSLSEAHATIERLRAENADMAERLCNSKTYDALKEHARKHGGRR